MYKDNFEIGLKPSAKLLQFFRYSHLPKDLQEVSRPFWDLANLLVTNLPENAEKTVAIRKLLEAKESALRASIYTELPIAVRP